MKRILAKGICGVLVLQFAWSIVMAGQGQPAKEEPVGTLTGQFLAEDIVRGRTAITV